jgi:hypothetical protein
MGNNTLIIGLSALGVAAYFFRDTIMTLLGRSIRKSNDVTDKKEQVMAQKEDDQHDAANAAKAEADRLANEAKNQTVDEDWNKHVEKK